jgi:hypothetical protein
MKVQMELIGAEMELLLPSFPTFSLLTMKLADLLHVKPYSADRTLQTSLTITTHCDTTLDRSFVAGIPCPAWCLCTVGRTCRHMRITIIASYVTISVDFLAASFVAEAMAVFIFLWV